GRLVNDDVVCERAPRFFRLPQVSHLLVLDRAQPSHVREALELSGQVAIELDRPEPQPLREWPGHNVRRSSTRPGGPSTTTSARATSSGGASSDATATVTPTSSSSTAPNASRSVVSSPANSARVRPGCSRRARTAVPLSA